MQLCRTKFQKSCILSAKNWIEYFPEKILSNRGENLDRSRLTGRVLERSGRTPDTRGSTWVYWSVRMETTALWPIIMIWTQLDRNRITYSNTRVAVQIPSTGIYHNNRAIIGEPKSHIICTHRITEIDCKEMWHRYPLFIFDHRAALIANVVRCMLCADRIQSALSMQYRA